MNDVQPLIAYVEDDEVIRANFADLFEGGGFRVLPLATYQEAVDQLVQASPDMAVIDIELGERAQGGLELCRMFREAYTDRPVILLTSHDQIELQTQGWELGADDYVTKGSSIHLILVRIKALLKRYQHMKAHYENGVSTEASGNSHQDIQIDNQNLAVFWKGKRLELSLTQFWILKAIYDAQGQVVGHRSLQDAANIVVEANTIVAHIKNIRAQFKRYDPEFQYIRTERGQGYRWLET